MSKRVLVVNKFYYPRGGDCVCAMELERLLSDQGHSTAVFAMDFPENTVTQWSKYFAKEVQFGGGVANLFRALLRTLGYGDICTSFNRILDDFKPDVVHLNNIHSYLSPRLAQLAHKRGIKVVWTLHDYKLICPSYSCLRNGTPCEKCFNNKTWVIKSRCMKDSLGASVIAWLEAVQWNRKVLEANTDFFICPSEFMKSKMLAGGFDKSKLVVNCNFVDSNKIDFHTLPVSEREDYCCYVGRLSEEKGVKSLFEVAAQLPCKLKIAGDGPLMPSEPIKNIEFMGRLNSAEVKRLMSNAKFSIIPSVCYENNPLSVIESLCMGTPVIGANIGGIPELIDEGQSGLFYKSGDSTSLVQAVADAYHHEWDYNKIAQKARTRFSAETHYANLIKIYNQ